MKKYLSLFLALLFLCTLSTPALALGVGASAAAPPAETAPATAAGPTAPADPNAICVTVGKKQTIDLSAYAGLGKASFKTADKKIAKVNSKGVVTGVKAGETAVTVTFKASGQTVIVPVTVTPKPYLKLSPSKATLYVGNSNIDHLDKLLLELSAEGYPAEMLDSLVWKSSNPDVVVVSEGYAFANGAGKATVTVSSPDGKYKASCKITVKEYKPKKMLAGTASCYNLTYGQAYDMVAKGYDDVETDRKETNYYRYGSNWTELWTFNKKNRLIGYLCIEEFSSYSAMFSDLVEICSNIIPEHGQPTHTYVWFEEPKGLQNLEEIDASAASVNEVMRLGMERGGMVIAYEWRFKDKSSVVATGYYENGVYTTAVGFGK